MIKMRSILEAAFWSAILVALIQGLPSPDAEADYQTFTIPNVIMTGGQIAQLNLNSKVSEAVSTPNIPSGSNIGDIGRRYTYSTGGSLSNLGHSIQYFFDWGDGTSSGWLPAGITTASKSWSSAAVYPIKVRARCATDFMVSSSSGTKILIF